MVDADKLLRITIDNQISIETILKQCEDMAISGQSYILIWKYLDTEKISKLGNLGFKVRKISGPMGEIAFCISWE